MGYLDYTLQKLNAINQMNEQRYREKRLEEETKSQFLNSLVGLVPQAISGISDAADKRAVEEDALNKLRLQEALLTGGDNTLAGIRPLTGANTLAPAAKGPVAAAPAAANTFGFINKPIEEEDNSLPGSERLASSGSDGQEGLPTDTSPNFNPLMDGLKRVTSDEEKLAQYEIAALRDANDSIMRRGGPSQDVEGQLPPSANKPYSITGGIVPGSIRRLESAAKPDINISGSTTEAEPNNIQSSFDIAQALTGLGVSPPAGDVVEPPVLDPNRDLGKSSFDISAPLSKLGPFSQAKLAGAKESMRDAELKAAAAKQAPLPLPAPAPTSLLPMTGRGGPTMPGAVDDENIEGEAPAAYRKRMEAKGYDPKKVNELIKKYYVTGSGTVDITEDTGTGGPRSAKPLQIGGDNPPTFSAGGSGGFGGPPVATAEPEKPWVKGRKTTVPTTVAEEVKVTNETGKTPAERLRNEEKVKAENFNTRVRTYKRLGNDDFKEPDIDKLAEKAVTEIFTKRPPGNPISEMINNITGAGQMTAERERLMRSIAKKTIIKNIKAERQAIADKDQQEFLATAKIELDAATSQNKAFGIQTSRKQIPISAKGELDSQREANNMLNDVRDRAYAIAEKDGVLPFGKNRFISEARIKQAAGAINSTADAISGSLSTPIGGGGVGQSKSRSASMDAQLLSDAFQAMDFSDLPQDQQDLMLLTKQAVQILGKAREGGKLTDADYVKYLQTLFNNSNPAGFIKSLDEVIKRNATRYNSNLQYFSANYGDDLSTYEPGGLRDQNVDIDFTKIKETPLGAAPTLAPKDPAKPKPTTPARPALDD